MFVAADQAVAQALIGVECAGVVGGNTALAFITDMGFCYPLVDLLFMWSFAHIIDQTAGIGRAVSECIAAFGYFHRFHAEGIHVRSEEAVFGGRQAVERLAG